MTRSWLHAIVAALFIGVLIVYSLFLRSSPAESQKQALLELDKNECLEFPYANIVDCALADIHSQLNTPLAFQLNRPYHDDSICVFIINVDKALKLQLSNKTRHLIEACHRDCLALPPNVILVDSKVFQLLMVSASNSMTGLLGNLDEMPPLYRTLSLSTPDSILTSLGPGFWEGFFLSIEKAHTVNIVANYIKYRNLYNYSQSVDSGEYTRANETAFTAAIKDLKVLCEDQDLDLCRLFVPFILPIVAHEMAHLQVNVPVVAAWRSQDIVSSVIAIQTDREDEADSLAYDASLQYIGRLPLEQAQIFLVGLTEYAGIFRDLVLWKAFDGFRGMDSRDVLFTLEDFDEPAAEDTTAYPDPNQIDCGYWNDPPLMTTRDLNEIAARVRQLGAFIGHSHLLARGAKLLRMIQEVYPPPPPIHMFEFYRGFDVLLSPTLVPESAYVTLVNGTNPSGGLNRGPLGLTLSDVTRGLDSLIRIEPALRSSGESAWVGTTSYSTLEIWGPRQNLTAIRYTRLIQAPERQEEAPEYAREVALDYLLLRNVHPDSLNAKKSAKGEQLLWYVYLMTAPTCAEFEENGRLYTCGRVNNTRFGRLTITASH
ncbi:hypothetical protein TRIP_C60040 [Candidatus Zixiibacteriota bacterium]|nr:hypothetical protein TRIP_C60040 [candidate division Zixibacteria bacterium]